ncbi:MAG: hypothetical protein OXU31_00500 [Gammaproteobacteria bacterium]|nr:hypothetical protein [Gammaproteobacteria bacterium]MDD9799825.1 hypothetical protein [Gammaproteobacteria bacterium]MDD9814456.1 hypothetical protein [Gammaproteobacteria bacterium]MDD9871450.1 hypothetical protein [Gammaproteobacteria bacterium]
MSILENQSRRAFIRKTGLLLTGTTAYTVVPNFAWAQGDSRVETLAALSRALFPHRHVPQKYYLACAQGLVDKAAGDSALAELLDRGIARLDAVYSRPFMELDEESRLLAMQRVHKSEFFGSVRGHAIVGLYNIPGIWKYFGYPGPSFSQGGYLNRGLDDIFWLNDV